MKIHWHCALITVISAIMLSGCTSPFVENFYKVRCWERKVCEGDEAFRKNDFVASVSEYDLALNYADNDARELATKIRLADSLTHAGDMARAEPLLDALKKTYAAAGDKLHSLEVILLLGNCRMQSKDWPGAKSYYTEALKKSRSLESDGQWAVRATHTQIKSLKALAAIALEESDATASGDYETQAQELRLRKASQDEVVGLEIILERATVASDTGDNKAVISLLEPYSKQPDLQRNTNSFGRMMLMLSKAYANNKEYEKCFDTYDRWITVVDADPFHKRNDVFRIYGRYGHALQKAGKFDRAIEMFNAAKEWMDDEPNEKSADLLLDLAASYRHKYEVKQAQDAIDEARKINSVLKLKKLTDDIAGEQDKLTRLPVRH